MAQPNASQKKRKTPLTCQGLGARAHGDESMNLAAAVDYIISLPQDRQDVSPTKPRHHGTSKNKAQELNDASSYELGEAIYQVKGDWVRKLYNDIATDDQIEEYLRLPSSAYDIEKKRWTSLSKDAMDENELRSSLIDIVSSIISHFYPNLQPGVTRSAVDSHHLLLTHDNGVHASQPPISIKASGPSFEVPRSPEHSEGLGYTNLASVIDARLDKSKFGRQEQAEKLAVICRQMFLHQPNRLFSRSLMITEKHARLVHFDRSGVYVTPLFSIHKDRELLIRLILGLTSPDETVLGLDTSVQWVIDEATGRKVSGTVTVEEYNDETETSTSHTYDLNMEEAPIVRPGIRGRGTTGWHATDPVTKESVLIKDAWRTDKRASEVEHLRTAIGIPGVVQMLAYQDFCAQTRDYRPPGHKSKGFYNRIKLRVVMKKYGTSIWHFKTRLELLHALRDVLSGHKALFDRGVLHRDISVENILFGSHDAPDGCRGILIDLDIAVRTEKGVSPLPPSSLTGTRFYQSVSILRAPELDPAPPQGYLDDLESIFYVLSHLVFLFTRPGVPLTRTPVTLQDWLVEQDSSAAVLKLGLFLSSIPLGSIPPYWGPTFRTLLEEFRGVIAPVMKQKAVVREGVDMTRADQVKAYLEISQNVDSSYEKVVAAFDKAIAQVKQEGLRPEETVQETSPDLRVTLANADAPPAPAQPATPSSAPVPSSKKRPSDDGEQGAPYKRRRSDVESSTKSEVSGSTVTEPSDES